MNKTQLREKLKKIIKKRMVNGIQNTEGKKIKKVIFPHYVDIPPWDKFDNENATLFIFTDNTFCLLLPINTDYYCGEQTYIQTDFDTWEFLNDYPYVDFYEKYNIFTKKELITWKKYLELIKQQKTLESEIKEKNQYEILKKKFE